MKPLDFEKILETPVDLISDYTDYYDEYFEKSSQGDRPIFPRLSEKLQTREKRLDLLRSWGVTTVPYGTVEEICNSLPMDVFEPYDEDTLVADHIYVAVYPLGSEKVPTRLPIMDATEQHPDNFGILCLEIEEMVVYRYVKLGEKVFWMKLSEKGTFLIDAPTTIEELHFLYPLAVIDFVKAEDADNFFAIDYSPAIAIDSTPIVDILPKDEAAYWIKKWILDAETMIDSLISQLEETSNV